MFVHLQQSVMNIETIGAMKAKGDNLVLTNRLLMKQRSKVF